jgi:hypothetical protein
MNKIWGTRWDITEDNIGEVKVTDFKNGNSRIDYFFLTAWCPPDFWLEKVSDKYKELEFKLSYDEPCGEFSGKYLYQNGDCILSVQK